MVESIQHYGTPRHSGRYPWGSGESPQRNKDFLTEVKELRKKGLTDNEIAAGMGMNSTQFRARRHHERIVRRQAMAAEAERLKAKGVSQQEIGRIMGINESSVRSLLDPAIKARTEITFNVANGLKEAVDSKKYIDIGLGAESSIEANGQIGISRVRLKNAVAMLQEEGYVVHEIQSKQLGTGKYTTIQVLCPPGTERAEVSRNREEIALMGDTVRFGDHGRTVLGLKPIQSVNSKDLMIRYKEDGGADMDGVIELRRGVKDLDLANSSYAQVRIGVDGTHYLKGMAIYADDLPDGVNIRFNTNKGKDVAKMDVLKKMNTKDDGTLDTDNPFGATIKRTPGGQRGALNIVNEEGDWNEWSKTLSSQFLSKQPPSLAQQQLDLAIKIKKEEYNEIMGLNNPVIKRRLLESFADDCDSQAVHLDAAGMPRQGWHVILPIPSLKPTEIYAPNYNDGEACVLIRYPHGGRFEIPEVTVNNRHPAAKRIMAGAKDGIGIHPKVAEVLSGADYDGDTVMVIPNPIGRDGKRVIKSQGVLDQLNGFDPKVAYAVPEAARVSKNNPGGIQRLTPSGKGLQMGNVSNLITDMTIKGADNDEIARAVRHSMVVIDAEKHYLNYRQSAIDNGIAELKTKYQGGANRGASTLISRSTSEQRVPERRERVDIDPDTGKKIYYNTNRTYVNRRGVVTPYTTSSTKGAEADDAFTLSSGTAMESIYANYSNQLKSMANDSRRNLVATKNIPYSPSARQTYRQEVDDLNRKLLTATQNKPRERQATLLANSIVSMKLQENRNITANERKKIEAQALAEARARSNARKELVTFTPREWQAVQAGAITNNMLTKLILNADLDQVKSYATPRATVELSSARIAAARARIGNGHTMADVAASLGISTSTLSKALNS